ncbi:hypothetical protein HQ520_01900 [bacterium]|nr:hypothetical protein [bacterium]
MTTKKQNAANRKNAQRSTGPRTPVGKTQSSQNSIKHGLLAKAPFRYDESEREWKSLAEAMRQDLAPVGAMEEILVERIIGCIWRLRRLSRVEAHLYRPEIDSRMGVPLPMEASFNFENRRRGFALLNRYEGGIERALYRALHHLERLQAAHRGAQVPPTVIVDVTTDSKPREG